MTFMPTHRHIKTSGYYQVMSIGFIEKGMVPSTIYKGTNGQVWVRPTAEFNDGRFEKVKATDLTFPRGAGKTTLANSAVMAMLWAMLPDEEIVVRHDCHALNFKRQPREKTNG